MSKRQLINKAIRTLRFEIEMAKKFAEQSDWELYEHTLCGIDARMDFLLEIGLLTGKQYSRLFGIVHGIGRVAA